MIWMYFHLLETPLQYRNSLILSKRYHISVTSDVLIVRVHERSSEQDGYKQLLNIASFKTKEILKMISVSCSPSSIRIRRGKNDAGAFLHPWLTNGSFSGHPDVTGP